MKYGMSIGSIWSKLTVIMDCTVLLLAASWVNFYIVSGQVSTESAHEKNLRCHPVKCFFKVIPSAKIKYHHYSDIIMSAMASQITGVLSVCSAVCSGADLRKPQSPASLAFVRGIHRSPVNSPHKGPVTRKMFPYYNIIKGNSFPKLARCSKIRQTKSFMSEAARLLGPGMHLKYQIMSHKLLAGGVKIA